MAVKELFRCALCQKMRDVKKSIVIKYDKNIDYLICDFHKEVAR